MVLMRGKQSKSNLYVLQSGGGCLCHKIGDGRRGQTGGCHCMRGQDLIEPGD